MLKFWRRPAERRTSTPDERARWEQEQKDDHRQREEVEQRIRFLDAEVRVITRQIETT